MTDTDSLSSLFNVLAFCVGVVLIIGLAFPSWRKGKPALPLSAIIGLTVFLAAFGFAIYLIFR